MKDEKKDRLEACPTLRASLRDGCNLVERSQPSHFVAG